MKVAITGATGFLGHAVVKSCVDAGYEVVAISRSTSISQWHDHIKVTCVQLDLASGDDFSDNLKGCDALIHLAAIMQGDELLHINRTITQSVITGLEAAGVQKLIGCSSIAILDYASTPPLSLITEDTPVNPRDEQLGAYALMKRDQERQLLDWAVKGRSLYMFRPGLIYSDENDLATSHAGIRCLSAKHSGSVPVVHISTVADAIVSALSLDSRQEIIHLINDQLPDQSLYLSTLRHANRYGKSLSVPWKAYAAISWLARNLMKLLRRNPDSFQVNSVAGRQKPFRFSNQKAKDVLGWKPAAGL